MFVYRNSGRWNFCIPFCSWHEIEDSPFSIFRLHNKMLYYACFILFLCVFFNLGEDFGVCQISDLFAVAQWKLKKNIPWSHFTLTDYSPKMRYSHEFWHDAFVRSCFLCSSVVESCGNLSKDFKNQWKKMIWNGQKMVECKRKMDILCWKIDKRNLKCFEISKKARKKP